MAVHDAEDSISPDDPLKTYTSEEILSDVPGSGSVDSGGEKPTRPRAIKSDASTETDTVADLSASTRPAGIETVAQGDSEQTYLPSTVDSVVQMWSDIVGDAQPGDTLKSPGESFAGVDATVETSTGNSRPDLSNKGYDLLDVLGEGGVGVVYQALQKSIDRKIAVKMIKPGVGRSQSEREKFVYEALVTGGLDHPNIVPIHDLDTTTDGQPFYTMKMVRGTPWSKVLRDESLEESIQILLAVCDAVGFAHSKGIIHRDLKPDNVMLGEFGEVQLMDWGMGARVGQGGCLSNVSASEAAGGTPAYMAPEMVTGRDGPVGIHSDVYLLGAILFQIVSGKPPHGGKRIMDTLENAHANLIQPTEADGILMDTAIRAMRTDPADRYHSVADFRAALVDYRSHAESINLCQRAGYDAVKAEDTQDYELFSQAIFGFRESLTLWEENAEAGQGLAHTQLRYAECAYKKGDLDLAATTLDRDCPEHKQLALQIAEAQEKRQAAQRRFLVLRRTAIALTAAVVLILTVASIWIYAAKQQAVVAKEEAVQAKETAEEAREEAVAAQASEAEQRKQAETAKSRAEQEETRAVQALADLEKAYTDLVEAQEQEKKARAEAKASQQVATETRDELAKTGMLLDNSWWVFDDAEARNRQEQAAEAIGKGVELSIPIKDGAELTMVIIPSGEFVMGSPPKEEDRAADEHLHRVVHTTPFYIGKYELSETQWLAITGQSPSNVTDRDADPGLPATGISAAEIAELLLPDAQQYAPEGYEFRLPSEAEWEYACRAGTSTAYCGGDGTTSLDAVGWYLGNSDRKVQPSGGLAPNAFGIFDMHGNVAELCRDQYLTDYYLESPTEDPICDIQGETPIVRGGSVLNMAQQCRSAYRSYAYRKNSYPFLGLRLVLAPIAATPQESANTEQ